MLLNNEIGVVQPLAEIGALCKERGVLLHTDAAQAVGKIPIDVQQLGVDLLGFSGHKIYGPRGIGALYVRRRDPHVRLEPQILGGGHQQGLRSGTPNVPGSWASPGQSPYARRRWQMRRHDWQSSARYFLKKSQNISRGSPSMDRPSTTLPCGGQEI